MSNERQNRYQRNLTLIQVYCGACYTIAGFLMAVGVALLVTGRSYLDETIIGQQQMDSPLIAEGFRLLSSGMWDVLAGSVILLATMWIAATLTRREFNRLNS